MSVKNLNYQFIKYQQRNGWSHKDLIRLAHVHSNNPDMNAAFRYAVKGEVPPVELSSDDPLGQIRRGFEQVHAFEAIKKAKTEAEAIFLIRSFNLPRECVPTQWLKSPKVWEALLMGEEGRGMPMTAMIRNLATMTRVGLVTPFSDASKHIVTELQNANRIKAARIHPIAVLSALRVYSAGGRSGYLSRSRGEPYSPDQQIVNALEETFYLAFGNVEPTGKRTLLALDVSGSMGGGEIAGIPGLTPRDAEAAMVMATVRAEVSDGNIKFPMYKVIAFDTETTELNFGPRDSLTSVIKKINKNNFDGTDCSLPMTWALQKKIPVDTFVVYTDNETSAGRVHPSQALRQYRDKMGIDSKLIVVGLTSTGFSIADPKDRGMLDVVGFDAAAPQLMSQFSRGLI